MWIRQADVFLAFQRDLVLDALRTRSAQDAVVAAALAPALYAETDDESARLLLAARPEDLLRDEVAEAQRKGLIR